MGYGMEGARKLRAKRDIVYEETTQLILAMPQCAQGQPFRRVDVINWGKLHNLGESVMTHQLQDMVEYNLLSARSCDHNGTVEYRRVPREALKHWRPVANDIPIGRYYGQVG